MNYATYEEVEIALMKKFTEAEIITVNDFLRKWRIKANAIFKLNEVDYANLDIEMLELINIDCVDNAKDWYFTIGKNLAINYTTLSSEGYSEAYSTAARSNEDFFKLSGTTKTVLGIASGIFSIPIVTNWGRFG